jgi:hypothetical protein
MKKALLLGGIIFLTLGTVQGQEQYVLSVNINNSNGSGKEVWSSQIERIVGADRSEVFLFEAENGSLSITFSLHPLDDERLLLVAGSDFRLYENQEGPLVSANLKSISLKKGEKVVYYPLGKNDESNEGGMLFFLEVTVNLLENENI